MIQIIIVLFRLILSTVEDEESPELIEASKFDEQAQGPSIDSNSDLYTSFSKRYDDEEVHLEKIKDFVQLFYNQEYFLYKRDIPKEEYISIILALHFLNSSLSAESIENFLGKDLSNKCKKRKTELREIFKCDERDFLKQLSKNKTLKKFLNLKFKISKRKKKHLYNTKIDEITNEIIECYVIEEDEIDDEALKLNIRYALYKLKKYLNA